MKIVSWNVNGLRKLKPLEEVFERLDADILCFQETRISGRFDPELESLAFVKGYHSFFSICKQRRGYSGVATFCKKETAVPFDAGEGLASDVGGAKIAPNAKQIFGKCQVQDCPCEEEGCSMDSLLLIEEEGRCVITDHKRFVLINVYIPAVSVEERVSFKMQFLHGLQAKINVLRDIGRHVVIVGDFNICPSVKDLAEPIPPSQLRAWEERPSRQWLMQLTAADGSNFVDTFREQHPDAKGAYTCWSEATRARENNFGVRIDLIVMDRELLCSDVTGSAIHADVQGSDHCPVSVTMKQPYASASVPRKPPTFCTANMPRFAVRQQTLKDMFSNKASEAKISKAPNSLQCTASSGSQRSSLKQKRRPPEKSTRPPFLEAKKARHNSTTNGLKLGARKSSGAQAQAHSQESGKSTGQVPGNGHGAHLDAARMKRRETAKAWRKLLCGPPPPPLCKHGKPCVLKAVTKTGENRGRTFFSCAYPAGIGREADCGFFKWAPFKAGQPLPK